MMISCHQMVIHQVIQQTRDQVVCGILMVQIRKLSKKQQPIKQPVKPSASRDDFDDLLQQLTQKVQKKEIKPSVASISSSRNVGNDNNIEMIFTNESFYPGASKPSTSNYLGIIDQKPEQKHTVSVRQNITPSSNIGNVRQPFNLRDQPVGMAKIGLTASVNEDANNKKRPAFGVSKKDDIPEEDALQFNIPSSRSGSMMKAPLRNRTISSSNQFQADQKPKQPLTLNLDRPEVIEARETRPTNTFSSAGRQVQPPAHFEVNSSRNERKGSLNIPFETSIIPVSTIGPKAALQNKPSIGNTFSASPVVLAPNTQQLRQQHKKQLDLVKETYERQLKFVNEQMQKILREQKQSKERIMNDFKELMAKEKQRNEKLMREEVQRVKDMASWQKDKLETMYKSEISSLKNSLENMKSLQQNNQRQVQPHSNFYQKRKLQDLQEKLKSQLQNIEAERKRLQKMENEFEQREQTFKKYKQQQEQRLKEEYTRISEKESKGMRKVAEAMKDLSEEKQRLALEMANVQLDLNRKKQELIYVANNTQIERQTFQKNRQQMENFNNQVYNSYRLKMQQAEESKRRSLQAENELVNKLRIVQMKSKQVERQGSVNDFYEADMPMATRNGEPLKTYSNNWLAQENSGTSAERMRQLKQSDRFRKVEQYVHEHGLKNRTNPNPSTYSQSSKFNLLEFTMGMDKCSRSRGSLHPVNKINVNT